MCKRTSLETEFHVYREQYEKAETDELRLRWALSELVEKNRELVRAQKLLVRRELSPLFGSVGLACWILCSLYRAVAVCASWMWSLSL